MSVDDARKKKRAAPVSVRNPEVQLAASLHRRRDRQNHGLTLLEGFRLVADAVAAGAAIHRVFVADDAPPARIAAVEGWSGVAASPMILPRSVFKRISDLDTPADVVAVVVPPHPVPLVELLAGARRVVVLDRIQDPGNLGTIVRTAFALGADGVVGLAGCCDFTAPKTLRATMGAIFRFPWASVGDPAGLLSACREAGIVCIATAADGEPLPAFAVPARVAWCFGSEGGGLAPALLDGCDRRVAIPMAEGAESLNVAAAAAICLYASLVTGTR